MRLTFDLNCIISIENFEDNNSFLVDLLKLHEEGEILVTVPAISGNEKTKAGNYATNFSDFKNRINHLTKRPIEILKPFSYLNMSFFDYCILSDDELLTLDRIIHEILFPNIPYNWFAYAEKFGLDINLIDEKWRNPRCDVISMWCHMYYKNEIFVTYDHNYYKKQKYDKLIELGANFIMKPQEALHYCSKIGFYET